MQALINIDITWYNKALFWMTFASIVSLLAAVLGHVEVVYSCPDVCKCIGSARVSVYCDFKGLSVRHLYVWTARRYWAIMLQWRRFQTTFLWKQHICIELSSHTAVQFLSLCFWRYLMGNQLTKIFPEMLQGTLRYSNNTFSRRKAALTQLKVMYVFSIIHWFASLILSFVAAWTWIRLSVSMNLTSSVFHHLN